MNLLFILKFYNFFSYSCLKHKNSSIVQFLNKSYFISNYYILNDLIWQEGLFIDFLQKKIADNWIKKFLIYSAYLFNERLVFDKVIRFFLDLIIWPLHQLFIFEFNNVAGTLFINIFIFIVSFYFFYFFYLFYLMF